MNGTKTTDRVQSLLTALQRVKEDMLSLGEDLLLSIRPTDKQSIEAGYQALKSYSECLGGFTRGFKATSGWLAPNTLCPCLPACRNPGCWDAPAQLRLPPPKTHTILAKTFDTPSHGNSNSKDMSKGDLLPPGANCTSPVARR